MTVKKTLKDAARAVKTATKKMVRKAEQALKPLTGAARGGTKVRQKSTKSKTTKRSTAKSG